MALYEFRNKITGITFEEIISYDKRDQYLLDNPELELIITPPHLGDPVRLGIRRTDQGFKEVMQKIHSTTPGSQLNIK
jgi:hypothetical protein